MFERVVYRTMNASHYLISKDIYAVFYWVECLSPHNSSPDTLLVFTLNTNGL